MWQVWMDWGSGRRDDVQSYEFGTLIELNAFLAGVSVAGMAWGVEDYRQYDSEKEVAAAEWID